MAATEREISVESCIGERAEQRGIVYLCIRIEVAGLSSKSVVSVWNYKYLSS